METVDTTKAPARKNFISRWLDKPVTFTFAFTWSFIIGMLASIGSSDSYNEHLQTGLLFIIAMNQYNRI